MGRNSGDRAEKINAIDELVKRVGTYSTSAELAELFLFIKKFPHMSPYNMFLIHMQKPGSSFVATAEEWQSRYKRNIKPGARPLVILMPFGPVEFVFELGDTERGEEEGEPLPEQIERPFRVKGALNERIWARLLRNLERYGIAYYEADHGVDAAGRIQRRKEETYKLVAKGKDAVFVRQCYNLIVNRNHTIEEKCATIAHELGHLFCGHLGRPSGYLDLWSERCRLSKNTMEFEAECVASLACGRLGIDSASERYLADYLHTGPDGLRREPPPFSVESILKATGMVEAMLQQSKQPPKRLIKEEKKPE